MRRGVPSIRSRPARPPETSEWPTEARPWLPDLGVRRRWPARWVLGLGCLIAAAVLLVPVVR